MSVIYVGRTFHINSRSLSGLSSIQAVPGWKVILLSNSDCRKSGFTFALMSRIERKYCWISASYLAGLFDIFILPHIWQNCVYFGDFLPMKTLWCLSWGIWISLAFIAGHISTFVPRTAIRGINFNLVPRVSHLTAWGERGETLLRVHRSAWFRLSTARRYVMLC